MNATIGSKNIYRVIYKDIAMSIYLDFAGLDIISENHEIAQELYNAIFDNMELGFSLGNAVLASGAKVVA